LFYRYPRRAELVYSLPTMRFPALVIVLIFRTVFADGQTLGGSTVFNFLRFSNTPQLTALGGENISNQSADIGLSYHNPALLREAMHTQASFVFNALYAGIKSYHLQLGYHSKAAATTFGLGILYFNYGNLAQTDVSGNISGDFHPRDYVLQLSMSRAYLARWFYGASFKYIGSQYGAYRSSGVAADFGVSYQDTASQLQASLVIKNLGIQLKSYSGSEREELPFDLQLGISKRLENAPIQFSLTLNRLHHFDVTYDDTLYNNENGLNQSKGQFSFDNIFRHIVLATQFYITDKLEISVGYNYLRRKELNVGSSANGINGFSAGLGVLFKKMQLRYARSYYQSNRSYHQLGVNMKLNELASLGNLGRSIGW